MRKIDHWIGAKSEEPASGKYLTTFDPKTLEDVAQVALGGVSEVERAVESADNAQAAWSALAPVERGRALIAIAHGIRAHADEIVELEVSETGKFPKIMENEVQSAAAGFEFYGSIIRAFFGEVIELGSSQHAYTRHEPYGVVGIITPWNYPFTQAARDIAPALATGNTVVVKPSEFTPSTTVLLAQIASEVGLPEGVFNVVTGTGIDVGTPLVNQLDVRKVVFTGSVVAGRKVAQIAVGRGVPVTLELGGKSPNIVFADADIDAVAREAVPAFTRHCGQGCACLTRLIVERSVHDEIVNRLVKVAEDLTPGTKLGPLTTKAQFQKVQSYFEIAKQDGAHLATGGVVATEGELAKGQYVKATIYTGVTPTMRIFREEIFGPVLTVTPFDTEEEAIQLANDTDYGLVAGLWTRDASRVHRVASRIEAGQVLVNGGKSGTELPFGGYKASGFGRAKGFEALRDCTQIKTVILSTSS